MTLDKPIRPLSASASSLKLTSALVRGLGKIGDGARGTACVLLWGGSWVVFCSGELGAGIPGLVLGKLTPAAIESDAFVLSQEKGEDVFKLLAGCWALGQRGDKPQG